MFIITNCTDNGNYTPSKAETYKEAKKWMVECTAENIRAAYDYDIQEDTGRNTSELSVNEIIDWAEENLSEYDFVLEDTWSYIAYSDGSFNEMKIFDLDEI